MQHVVPLLEPESPFAPNGDPTVTYGVERRMLSYAGRGDRVVRVTFDRWDALRVCRGEHAPYSSETWIPVGTVEGSAWLQERYEYESKFYRGSYGFNNNVDEMLEEFEHFIFSFHDQFVEVIAGGVWFDFIDSTERHPLSALPASAIVERSIIEGITCQVRKDPRPLDEIIAASRLCDQSLLQLVLELDASDRPSKQLTVRTRNGKTVSRWRGYFGAVELAFDGVPSLEALRPAIAAHAKEVAERRRAMGKP